jgi:hypothetical protein
MQLIPETTLGKVSVGFGIVFAILPFTHARGTLRTLTTRGAEVSAVLAFFTGIMSIRKKGERSILVSVSTQAGAVMILFLLLELLFPHGLW